MGGSRWQAALTKSSRVSTARWCGLGERDEKVYERNRCLNPRYVEPTRTWRIWVGIAVRVDVCIVKRPPGLSWSGLPVRKVCGVLTGTVGVKSGASLVDRIHVNMGTIA